MTIPYEIRHFTDNAEKLLREGAGSEFVFQSLLKLNVDARVAEEILDEAESRIRKARQPTEKTSRGRVRRLLSYACLLSALGFLTLVALKPGVGVVSGLLRLGGFVFATAFLGFLPALLYGSLRKGEIEFHQWMDSNEPTWGLLWGVSCLFLALLAYRVWS